MTVEPWTPTRGHWEPDGQTWTWKCPDCGERQFREACAVDMRCNGPEGNEHLVRIGIRPDAPISGPAALMRELMRAGTVERITLLAGALELAKRASAADALMQLADELDEANLPFITPGALRDLAKEHLTGDR